MPFALPILLLVSLCLPSINGNDVNTNLSETHALGVTTNRPLHRNQTKTARNDQLLSLLAARRREIIQKRFRDHLKNIVDLSSGNSSSPVPKPITSFPNATKTLNVHLNLSDLLLHSEDNVNPSTESNVVNVSSPRNPQKRKNEEPSQAQENKTKNMPIIRNILYRRKMSFLNRKLPLDLEQIAYDTLGLTDVKNPEDLILDNEDSLQVEESSHDKLIYYDVKNNASKKSGNNFEDTSEEIKTMSMNNKTVHNTRKNFVNTTTTTTTTTTTLKPNIENVTNEINKTEIKQQSKNTTRFMSQSLYNYFRPLDVPEEEMQPFLRFGEKIPSIKNSRNQSHYTPNKSIEENSSTVKIEEEIDENMDVSVLKPMLYENKIAKVNLPPQKVTVARDYFKNRIQGKKNGTETAPKVDKKTYMHNYRNITRNRGFRNSTIFVQNKRSGIRHTINLKGNSSIANLKPVATTELIQNTSTTIITPVTSTEETIHDKIIKLQNMPLKTNKTQIKIPENQTEVIATVLPETTKLTTKHPQTNHTKSTTESSTFKTNSFTKQPETTTAKVSTTITPTRTTLRTKEPIVSTTQNPIVSSTSTTRKTNQSTTQTTPTKLNETRQITTSMQPETKTTQRTTESSTTNPTTGGFSTAVVTSVSIESSKSRANKTVDNLQKIEQPKHEQSTTTDINDFDATVIATLNNFTSQGLQNNTQMHGNQSSRNPPIVRTNLDVPININITRQNKIPFILRPTTPAVTIPSEFIINVPDIETTPTETLETTTFKTESIVPTIKIVSRFNSYTNDSTVSQTVSTTGTPTTKTPRKMFNTTVLTKPESELELPLATLFSVTEFKKPEVSTNTTKFFKPSGSETVISRKSESDESIDNIHAAYILAALGFLPMMVIVIYVIRSIMKKKPKIIEDYETEMHDSEKKSIIHPVARLPTLMLDPSNRWEFPRSKLRLQTLLGQGNFGQVWKAEADDLKGHVGLTRLVAVKTIKDGAGTKERDDLLKELAIMQKMGSHPNVVTLLGCCTDKEPYLLIMEYVMYGKLLTFLRDHRTRRDYYNFSDDAATLTARDLTVFAYCVARGMEYLSSKGIIHRDLAARNILVDHNKLCKIADFGMSRDASATGGEVTEPRAPRNALPVRWMAVESLLYSIFTHKTDVWAFGVLLWEIVTLGSSPYANMSGREVMRLVCAGYRLERPGHCRPELYGVMARTWTADPQSRPTFQELREDLAALLEQPHPDGSYVDLESFRADPTPYEIDNCTPRGNYFTVKSRFSEFECDI